MTKRYLVGLLLVCGCASMDRDCQSYGASNFGADWIVLQYGYDGRPINCWKLREVAISNEHATDGIYWEAKGGSMVHISGWYNRVQVVGNDYESAARQLGIDLNLCGEGAYLHAVVIPPEPPVVQASPVIQASPVVEHAPAPKTKGKLP
jgi:hypothetical protein